ncbi:hypothetical protein B0H13DRAFT_2337798 [Mycena leptocephala]|nr:hypothetical protein B0H13DRAFT_2337798 [Mycena leptocephala]
MDASTVSRTNDSSSRVILDTRPRSHLTKSERHFAAVEAPLAESESSGVQWAGDGVHPVLGIPPEILSEIFLHCVELTYRRSPLRLASICNAWRAVALSTPALWTSFHASHINAGPSTVDNMFRSLQCWLPRAGSLPLDLNIRFPSLMSLWGPVEPILSILAQYSSQWSTVNLDLLEPISFPIDSTRGLPSLRKLSLHLIYPPRDDKPFTTVTTFLRAPQLREAVLKNISPVRISLPWIQLTSLHLYGDAKTSVEVLKLTPNLEILSAFLDFLYGPPTPIIVLPRLHTLRLISFHYEPPTLLQNLTLPGIGKLDLEHFQIYHLAALDSFLARSKSSIKTLNLNMGAYNPAHHCISSLPSLTHLKIRYVGPEWSISNLTSLLYEMTTTPRFLPVLESLDLEWHKTDIAMGSLVSMLAARWAGKNETTKLAFFRLSFDGEVWYTSAREAVRQLSQLRNQARELGVPIVIKGSEENMASSFPSFSSTPPYYLPRAQRLTWDRLFDSGSGTITRKQCGCMPTNFC